MKIILMLALIAQALIYSVSSDAAIFSKNGRNPFDDPREEMDRSKYPALNAIGIVRVDGYGLRKANADETNDFVNGSPTAGEGTGFLINKCLAFTNHHVVFRDRNAEDYQIHSLTFAFGGNDNKKPKYVLPATVVAHGDYRKNLKTNVYSIGSKDWAIIKINQSVPDPRWRMIPKFIKNDPVDMKPFNEEKYVSTAAYYIDLTNDVKGYPLYGQKQCDMLYPAYNSMQSLRDKKKEDLNGLWTTDCPAIPGASGSPVFDEILSPNQTIYAYGLMTRGAHLFKDDVKYDPMNPLETSEHYFINASDATLNSMNPFSEMMTEKQLQKIIKDNPCN